MQSNEAQGKRLNKFIADSGYCSRREADRLIQEGRVTIDGRVGALGDGCCPACGWCATVTNCPVGGKGCTSS